MQLDQVLTALQSNTREDLQSLLKNYGEALYKGTWWAPRQTATLRTAVATALAKIGTDEAFHVLEEAAASGPRGIRNAVKPLIERAQSQAARLKAQGAKGKSHADGRP